MSAIEQYQWNNLPARQPRWVSRAQTQLNGSTEVGMARIESRASLQAAKTDALAQVGRHTMQEITLLTQMEQQCAQAVPLAASRVEAIGNMVTLAMTNLLMDTACKLSQL
jgi:hypothetical protein